MRNHLVAFMSTKGKRTRSIPIALELEARIQRHLKVHGPLSKCLNRFDKTLVVSGPQVPNGQSSHVLRHTFASHFIMNGGNILTLQKILGHTSLAMTMRYAHLAPDHLQDAKRLGPSWREIFEVDGPSKPWPALYCGTLLLPGLSSVASLISNLTIIVSRARLLTTARFRNVYIWIDRSSIGHFFFLKYLTNTTESLCNLEITAGLWPIGQPQASKRYSWHY